MDKGLLTFSEQTRAVASRPRLFASRRGHHVFRELVDLGSGMVAVQSGRVRQVGRRAQASFPAAQLSRTGLRHRTDHS
jgi:hypothetical protein